MQAYFPSVLTATTASPPSSFWLELLFDPDGAKLAAYLASIKSGEVVEPTPVELISALVDKAAAYGSKHPQLLRLAGQIAVGTGPVLVAQMQDGVQTLGSVFEHLHSSGQVEASPACRLLHSLWRLRHICDALGFALFASTTPLTSTADPPAHDPAVVFKRMNGSDAVDCVAEALSAPSPNLLSDDTHGRGVALTWLATALFTQDKLEDAAVWYAKLLDVPDGMRGVLPHSRARAALVACRGAAAVGEAAAPPAPPSPPSLPTLQPLVLSSDSFPSIPSATTASADDTATPFDVALAAVSRALQPPAQATPAETAAKPLKRARSNGTNSGGPVSKDAVMSGCVAVAVDQDLKVASNVVAAFLRFGTTPGDVVDASSDCPWDQLADWAQFANAALRPLVDPYVLAADSVAATQVHAGALAIAACGTVAETRRSAGAGAGGGGDSAGGGGPPGGLLTLLSLWQTAPVDLNPCFTFVVKHCSVHVGVAVGFVLVRHLADRSRRFAQLLSFLPPPPGSPPSSSVGGGGGGAAAAGGTSSGENPADPGLFAVVVSFLDRVCSKMGVTPTATMSVSTMRAASTVLTPCQWLCAATTLATLVAASPSTTPTPSPPSSMFTVAGTPPLPPAPTRAVLRRAIHALCTTSGPVVKQQGPSSGSTDSWTPGPVTGLVQPDGQWAAALLSVVVQCLLRLGAVAQAAVVSQFCDDSDTALHTAVVDAIQASSAVAEAYYVCLWELPLVELFVAMHLDQAGADAPPPPSAAALTDFVASPERNASNPFELRFELASALFGRAVLMLADEFGV